jgi:hypothetical protein
LTIIILDVEERHPSNWKQHEDPKKLPKDFESPAGHTSVALFEE